ncbi:MAG: class I SAM-dependent methyltransferase [Fibrobacter sp.]|nr:class I SAM-dependent methyltransferase [Fibrobacter sp.]
MDKIFVDSKGKLFQGKKAAGLIKEKNDLMFLSDDGVVSVSEMRWKEAQKYELNFAMKKQKAHSDDRNIEHYNRFDSYNILNELDVDNYIEMGCGPFTNSRLILNKFKSVKKVFLLDPLIDSYIKHKNCTYKGDNLCGYKVNRLCSSIENIDSELKFDVIVLINVLEHCYDIPLIFNKLYDQLNKNGTIVFSEATIQKDNLEEIVSSIYDVGHSIRLSTEFVEKFLRKFEQLYRKDFYKLYNQPWRHDVYFIGRKI